MSEAVIIGLSRSTPGLFMMRRRMRRLRWASWRWTLAFTRKPPGVEWSRGVMYLDCSGKPGGFRASQPQNTSDYAWLRTRVTCRARRTSSDVASEPTLAPNCREEVAGRHITGLPTEEQKP